MANVRSDVVDPVHLSDLLRAAGELDNDRIAQVIVESERQTLVSTIRRLRVDLDGGSSALRLFLKTTRSDSGIDVPSSREAGFYIRVAPGYGFDALWLDYRLSVLWQVMTPIWQAALKLGPWIWFGHFEGIMTAVDDLGCLEFLD